MISKGAKLIRFADPFHTAYQEKGRKKHRNSLRVVGTTSRRPNDCRNSDTYNYLGGMHS